METNYLSRGMRNPIQRKYVTVELSRLSPPKLAGDLELVVDPHKLLFSSSAGAISVYRNNVFFFVFRSTFAANSLQTQENRDFHNSNEKIKCETLQFVLLAFSYTSSARVAVL